MRRDFQNGTYLCQSAYSSNLADGPDGPGVKQLRDMIHANESRNERLNNVLTYAKPKESLD